MISAHGVLKPMLLVGQAPAGIERVPMPLRERSSVAPPRRSRSRSA